jgi:membrane protein
MFRSMLKRRIVSFTLVLAVGLVLLVSLTLSTGLMALGDLVASQIPLPVALVALGNEVLSFLVLTVLIAMIYRVLPDAKLDWQDVGIGAVVTSLLFSAGRWLIGFYLVRASVGSRFGVAGSLIVILLWVFCESYILLFGAEVTAVYSSRYRRRPVTPEAGATSAGAHAARDLA